MITDIDAIVIGGEPEGETIPPWYKRTTVLIVIALAGWAGTIGQAAWIRANPSTKTTIVKYEEGTKYCALSERLTC
jgi:hypothetical protein